MPASSSGPKVTFLLAFHHHQPVGNFDNVFQEALDKCYEPLLQFLEGHPRFRVSLHYSGCLFDWLEAHEPRFLNRLAKIVERKQVELIGGGYYEPILSLIPERDAIGQLIFMNEYLKKRFKIKTNGFWLTERVWEPKLPRLAGDAGLAYTATDDTHFSMAGMAKDDILDFYVTEEEGRILYVFPILKELRYLIPFKEPHETVEFLRRKSSGKDVVITFADDAEKFGLWPGTYQWVYREGWLERFALALEENRSWIQLKTFSEVLAEKKPRGSVYLPTASYDEMLEWSLSLEKGKKYHDLRRNLENAALWNQAASFFHSGYFKNFLVKYPEAAMMRHRLEYTSRKVEQIKDPVTKRKAQDALWKGECNCPYWHGVFGGLYLHHLRRSTYENLISADKLSNPLNGRSQKPSKRSNSPFCSEETDFDKDGQMEWVIENRMLKFFLKPQKGGRIVELDLKPLSLNVLDTVTRREEAYHANIKVGSREGSSGTASIHDIVKTVSPQVMERLAFDSYDRGSSLDWFFPSDASFENYKKGKCAALANTVREPYDISVKQNVETYDIRLSREVEFLTGGSVLLERMICLKKATSSFTVTVTLSNRTEKELQFLYGQEWNFTFYEQAQNQNGLRDVEIQDGWSRARLRLESPSPFDYWQYPIETLAQTEQDFQLMHQGLCVFPHWLIRLPAKKKWGATLNFLYTDTGKSFAR